MGTKNKYNELKGVTRVDALNTDKSWNTESGTFSFEDTVAEEGGNKFAVEEQATANRSASPTPVQQSASFDTVGRAPGSHRSASPLTVQRSTDTAGRNAAGQNFRITMFGSEYARILSSSKPPSTSPSGYAPPFSTSKAKRSAVSNKIKARFSSSISVAQSYASSAKESVDSVGSVLLSLEDCPNSVATAAITDVAVTSGSDIPPRGYYRAFQLGEEFPKNMVPGRKRQRLYLNVKKEPSWDRAAQRPCVTAFCVIYPDRNEFVPPGFSVVRHYQPSGSSEGGSKKKDGSSNGDQIGSSASPAANINLSSSGERVYICYRRSREGNPITGIMCLRPSKGDLIPEGYTVLERTPRNFLADMAAKSEQPLFLAYRQRLENLECLRPLPLVLSILHSRPDAGRKELKAYYCTGGAIVPSDVGRYHIMDRSTHTLMSSSSAQSRLNLIQSSRKESETAVPAWVSSASTHIPSSQINGNQNLQRTVSSVESPSQKDDCSGSSGRKLATESFDSFEGFASSPSQNSLASSTTSNTPHQSPTLTKSTSPGHSSNFSHSDDTLQTSLDAMHFIPPIECARTVFQVEGATHSESVLQSRVAAITPILTSCYTSQGGSALMAVEGLISMLNETNFFAQDVADEDGNIESSTRLTILDLVIQVVCDVATSSARETYFRSCVDFVSDAVRYAGGKLNDRTIGFVLRFYLFVFYFGASIPTNGWPFNKEWHESKAGILDDFLLSDSLEQNEEGGAPQAAAIALKEFISIMLSRTGLENTQRQSFNSNDEDELSPQPYASKILSYLVENAMNRVDVANYTQLAMYQIHRSGGSELFWYDMINSIGEGLFGQDASSNQGVVHSNIISFAILASFVKICSGKVRMIFHNTEPVPRDVASKLLSFELLEHFIKMWHVAVSAEDVICGTEEANSVKSLAAQNSYEMESVATMIYAVRRLVVPTLLSNTSAAIEDCRVYRRVLRIISQLWCNPYYRCQMKIDLAVLIEHFVLKVLCLGPQVNTTNHGDSSEGVAPTLPGGMPSLFHQQLDVLEEMKIWFSSNPKDVLDFYANFDNQEGMLPGSYCSLLNKICAALSTLAEQCGAIISEHGRFSSINGGGNGSPRRSAIFPRENEKSKSNVRERAQSMREKSFDAITAIAKSMMNCAIISHKEKEDHLLVTVALGVADSYTDDSPASLGLGLSPQLSPGPSFGDKNIVDYWKTSIEKRKAPLQPILLASSYEIETPSSFSIKQSMSEDSSKQAQLQNKQESFEVAFELIAAKGLKKGIDYLIACSLLSPSPRHISAFLRIHQSSIDQGILGEYLGEGGIDGADVDFWNLVRFNFARATSFVGMNIEQALRHFLTSCGFRLPGEAQKIDRIISTFSQCYWEDNAGDLQKCPFQNQDTVFLVSFAIIMLNTDLHKSHASKGKVPKRMTKNEFITNLRGVYDGVDKFRDYIHIIYDSIEATPIVISNFSPQNKRSKLEQGSQSLPFKDQTDLATSIQSWVKSVKPAQELLRTVDVRHDNFISVDGQMDDETSLQDITCQMFSANWHHIHGAINATIDNAHLDLAGLGCCIDVLEYSLCAASYLGMTVERKAFSKLLGRVNRFNDLKVQKKGAMEEKIRKGSTSKAKSEVPINFEDVDQVKCLTRKLHTSLFVDDTKIETMKQIASRIRNGDILLNDSSRTFVREGDLIKRHQLVGRSSTYRFFLFSDVLVYAHKSSHGDYKVHEEMPLHLMKVEDNGNPSSNTKQNSFHIHHPNKSFLAVALNKIEKQQWIDDINNSIRREIKRKAKVETSRIEAARRAKV